MVARRVARTYCIPWLAVGRARRYFGQLFVEWCEDTEWRKKMREDADKKSQAGVDGKVDESKAARKREEERTAGGATKKKK